MKKLLTLFILFTALSSLAQTPISGIVNSYDTLVAQTSLTCYDELQTNGATSYQAGDFLLIIKSGGATYDTTNSNSFGDLLNLNSAGLFDFAFVSAYNAGKIELDRNLQHNYPSGTQIIKVPQYAYAEVKPGPLTGKVYDGKTGGIVALKARKLELSAPITANALGYAGGYSTRNMGYSCGQSGLFFPANDNGGAPKGSGPASIFQHQLNGRGSVSLAGGGGNNHNAGGGGGANAGAGGTGGDEWVSCTPTASNGGMGGKGINASTSGRIFMGGGGGSGHNNLNNFSSEGGRGGGIIILIVDTLISNGFSISAAGDPGKSITANGSEGAGGGGAGGSILFSASHATGSFLITARGGLGGNVTSGTAGPGGGGGGGIVRIPAANQLNAGANITTEVKGGISGNLGSPANKYGATDGQNGFSASDFFFTPQPANPVADFFPADTLLCADNFILQTSHPGPYLWSTGSTDSAIVVSSSGTYWLRAGNMGCQLIDSIDVRLTKPFQFSLGADTSLCPGDTMILRAPADTALNLRWEDGSSARQRTVNPGAVYWLEARKDSCVSRDSIWINVINTPEPVIFNSSDTTICSNSGIQVDLTHLPGQILWQDGNSKKLRTLSDSGWYWVEWNTPCSVFRDSLFLETTNCDSCLITLPNAFTPNNDGLNDKFQAFFGCEVLDVKLQVLNRWGAEIFSSIDAETWWDGKFKGRLAPEGVYIYKITYRTLNQLEPSFEQGVIYLIR